MEYLFIYLLQVAEAIQEIGVLSAAIGTFAFFAFILSLLARQMGYDNEEKKDAEKFIEYSLKTLTVSAIIITVITFIPTKQTLLLMGGTFIGKKAVTSIVQSKTTEKVMKLIDIELDKYIKEASKEG